MPGLYSARRHREELSSLSEEYETRLKELQAALTELKEENRRLSAEISLLRAQKQSISDAIIAAGEKREATGIGRFFGGSKSPRRTGGRKGAAIARGRARGVSRRGDVGPVFDV